MNTLIYLWTGTKDDHYVTVSLYIKASTNPIIFITNLTVIDFIIKIKV